jgi:hypothetical protein
MNSDLSEETLNTSNSDSDERRQLKTKQDTTVAIFDWDDTLFCTKYLELLQIDCKKIFSEEKALEDYGTYLIHEMQTLEEVKLPLFLENHQFVIGTDREANKNFYHHKCR